MGPPPLPCAVPRAPPPAEASPAPTTAIDSAAAALPSALSYTPPSWSAPPSSTFTLEAIKDGLVVEALDVSARPFYVIGRHPSTADLVVAHPSVSRQHAVLQFRDTGEAFLFDLASTHGTTINKQAVPARTYVAVRVGAMIRLGQSSRSLCLMGNANPARESETDAAAAAAAAAAARTDAQEQRAEQRAARIAAQTGRSRVTESDLHAAGAGWGFDEDAVDGDAAAEADEDCLGAISFEQLSAQAKAKGLPLTAKQERLVEQLDKRVTKMEHVKQETERIAAKEVEGLSEGQRAQIERNAQALAQLGEQVESIKEQLSVTLRDQLGMRRMLDGKAAEVVAARAQGSDDEYADSDGDDDYFDRTASHRGRGTAHSQQQQPKAGPHASGRGGGEATAESEASLRAKLSATLAERVEVVLAQDALSAERAALEAQAAADPLEAYMLANTAEMQSRRARELSSHLETLTADEARLRKLIAFVAPALPSLPPASAAAPAPAAAASLAAPPSMATSTKRPAPMPPAPVPRGLPSPGEDGLTSGGAAKRARAATEAAEAAEQDGRPQRPTASVTGPPKPLTQAYDQAMGPPKPMIKPMSASEQFRSQYAAAVSSLITSGPISVTASDVPTDAGSSNRSEGSTCAADEAQVTGEARSGLGFGAARPDAARVDSARQAMLAAQAQAKREAALAPGLNRPSAQPLSAVHPPLAPPPGGPAGPKRGPSMPPPPSAGARRAEGGANQLTGPRAHDDKSIEEDAPMCTSDEFEWRPPLEQDGSGQTTLNKKLGY